VSEEPLFRGSEFVVTPISEIRMLPNGKELQFAREAQFNSRHPLVFERVYEVAPVGNDEHSDRDLAAVDFAWAKFALGLGDVVTYLHANEGAIVKG